MTDYNINMGCPFCGKNTPVHLLEDEYNLYISSSVNVQDIFPQWSPTQREVLISGICPDCQRETFD